MLPLRTASKKFWAASACAGVAMFVSTQAFCSFNQVGLGMSVPQPLSSAGDTLTRPIGFTGNVEFDAPAFMPSQIDLRADVDFQPYSVKNLSSLPNNLQANVNMFGFFAGVQLWG